MPTNREVARAEKRATYTPEQVEAARAARTPEENAVILGARRAAIRAERKSAS